MLSNVSTVYIDGGYSSVNKVSGVGGIMEYQGKIWWVLHIGTIGEGSNNRSELFALISFLGAWLGLANWSSLQATKPPQGPIDIYSDSKYVVEGVNSYLANWKKNGWKTVTGEPVANQDMWRLIDMLWSLMPYACPPRISWVKGHSGVAGNEYADKMATKAMKSMLHLSNHGTDTTVHLNKFHSWTALLSSALGVEV